MTDHTTPAAPEDQAFPRPVVARHTARAPAWVLFAGMAVVAFVVVALLTLQRTHKAAPVATLTARPVSALTRVDFQPPPDVAAVAQAGRGSGGEGGQVGVQVGQGAGEQQGHGGDALGDDAGAVGQRAKDDLPVIHRVQQPEPLPRFQTQFFRR